MSKADAMSLTGPELNAVTKAFREQETEQWKRTRWLATLMVNMSGKSAKRDVKPTELMRFDDERVDNGFNKFWNEWQAAT
tara:strand:- start:319 stop:558 length:240 start_codon:yes stop_codon:yes gene_type:complete